MKKLVLSVVCAGIALGALAQEAATDKKVQAGLAYQFGLNFNKPGTKVIERDGSGVANSIGLSLNFALTPNIAVATGLEFDFESFKYDVTSTDAIYYRYSDTKIFQKEDGTTATTLYNLQNRKQKAIYGTIPTMLLFRTNPIGDFRYYGKFGARTSVLLGNTIFDEGFNLTGDSLTGIKVAQQNNEMKAAGDMFFLRSTIGISGGAEWNFTGNTSLYAEIGFHYGFTPVHNIGDNMDNMTLFKYNAATGTEDYLRFSAKQKQILLKIGILF